MVEVTTRTKITADADEICKDPMALKDKNAVLKQAGKSAVFASISQVSTFMAGIMTAAAMGLVGTALKAGGIGLGTEGGAAIAAGSAIPIAGFAIPTAGLVLLGVAAAITLVAVVSNVMASHAGSSAYFDQSEANAKHNAKYIVKELKQAHSKQFEEHEQNQRADGQKWSQVVSQNAEQQRLVAGQTQL